MELSILSLRILRQKTIVNDIKIYKGHSVSRYEKKSHILYKSLWNHSGHLLCTKFDIWFLNLQFYNLLQVSLSCEK